MNKQLKPLRRFVKSCCLVAENARYPALDLYLTYVNWCINRKVDGQDITEEVSTDGGGKIIDLMEALKASLTATKPEQAQKVS